MSANGGSEDQAITAEEYQRGIAAQEEEANLVLGGDDGKDCTYSKGYMTRQAVFACVTCTPQGGAGFCLACSLTCHDGHDVLEIYTKRNFRCDCGNSKFPGLACKLTPEKDPLNAHNSYNQNYSGLYCTCHRPYPDPERGDEEDGETMFQCVVCEDWLHVEHLGLKDGEEVPNENDEPNFEELICPGCLTDRCPFVSAYPELQLEPIPPSEPISTPVDLPSHSPSASDLPNESPHSAEVGKPSRGGGESSPQNTSFFSASDTRSGLLHGGQSNGAKLPPAAIALVAELARIQAPSSTSTPESTSVGGGSNTGLNDPPEERTSFASFNTLLRGEESSTGIGSPTNGRQTVGKTRGEKRKERADSNCPRGAPLGGFAPPKRAAFLVRGWREKLCRCTECMLTYADKKVTFLLEGGDTVAAYEEEARVRGGENQSLLTAEDSLDGFLQSMPWMQQLELVHGFNEMRSGLRAYLAPFARSGATVTVENIRGFFEELRSKRRRID